jgi:putative transcriptional regulator
MKTVRVKIEPASAQRKRVGRFNSVKVDATSEAEIATHMAKDEALAAQVAAKFARRVSRRTGLSPPA